MSGGSLILLQLRRAPARELLLDTTIIGHQADLLSLAWDMDFSDLGADEESAELLLSAFGAELLGKHRDERGVLVVPATLFGGNAGGGVAVEVRGYATGVAAYGSAGLWLKNLAHEADAGLRAVHEAEMPLPRFPQSKLIELHVVKAVRAMRELELSEPPLRTVRLELRTTATPREVSAFYLPLLKAAGLAVKRRVWSSGSAERLIGSSAAARAFIHSEKRGPRETLIQISWVELS